MALLVMDGFEFAPAIRAAYTVSGSPTAGTGRDGVGKCLIPGSVTDVVIPLPSVATVIIGLGLWPNSASYGGTGFFLQLRGDAGATQHLSFLFDATGHIIVKRGSGSGTLLATGTNVIASNAWHWVEIKATIADAGGTCIVKVDGIQEFSFTGDTKNAGTATTVSSVDIPGTASSSRYDDLVICDATGSAPFNDFFGEKVIKVKRPNGNGAANAWVGSDGNSVDNYLLVDELPVSSSDYTGSATATDRDLYALSSVTGLASVDAIQNVAYVAKSDAGARSFKTVTRNSGGTVTTSSTVALSTTYALAAGGIEQADPSAAAWTTSNVNTIQAGVECV